jgi:hypothetical protein
MAELHGGHLGGTRWPTTSCWPSWMSLSSFDCLPNASSHEINDMTFERNVDTFIFCFMHVLKSSKIIP